MWNYWYSMDNFRGIFFGCICIGIMVDCISTCAKQCRLEKRQAEEAKRQADKEKTREIDNSPGIGYGKVSQLGRFTDGGKRRSKKKSSKRKSKRKSSKKGRKSRRKRRTRK